MNSLGERLRSRRLEAGIDLSQISAETRISVRYLEALENDDYKSLPGVVFARSFARQYARFIGMDESEIEPDLLQLAEPEVPVVLADHERAKAGMDLAPLPDAVGVKARASGRRMAAGALALVVVVACTSLVYIFWQRQATIMVPPAVTALPSDVTASPPAATAQAPPEALVPAGSPAQPVAATATLPPGGVEVNIRATEATWVKITAEGKVLFSGILQPSQSKTLVVAGRANMVVGNAGGIEILTNGRPVGPIGPRGQVRLVRLSPEGTEILRQWQAPGLANPDGAANTSPIS